MEFLQLHSEFGAGLSLSLLILQVLGEERVLHFKAFLDDFFKSRSHPQCCGGRACPKEHKASRLDRGGFQISEMTFRDRMVREVGCFDELYDID